MKRKLKILFLALMLAAIGFGTVSAATINDFKYNISTSPGSDQVEVNLLIVPDKAVEGDVNDVLNKTFDMTQFKISWSKDGGSTNQERMTYLDFDKGKLTKTIAYQDAKNITFTISEPSKSNYVSSKFNFNVEAKTLNASSSSSTSGDTKIQNGITKDDKEWFSFITEPLKNLTDNVSNIMSSVREFFELGFTGMLEVTFGNIFESTLKAVSGSSSQWLFCTPYLYSSDFKGWVYSLWLVFEIFGVAALLIGIMIAVFATYAGKSETNRVVKVMLATAVGITMTIFLAEGIIWFCNMGTDAAVREPLSKQYSELKKDNVPGIVKNLDPKTIGFSSFDGNTILKMAFSGGKKDTQIYSPDYKFYRLFASAPTKEEKASGRFEPGGGLIVMTWAMVMLIFLMLFSVLRYATVGLLCALSPFWFVKSMFKRDYDPIIGWLSLFTRSVLVSFIFDMAWLVCMYSNDPKGAIMEMGINPQFISCIVFTIATLLVFWFFIRHLFKAVTNPMNLNGLAVKTSWGQTLQKVGNSMQDVGYNLGGSRIGKISKFGNAMQRTGGRLAAEGYEREQIKKEKEAGNYDYKKGATQERIKRAIQDYDTRLMDRSRRTGVVDDSRKLFRPERIELDTVKAVGLEQNEIREVLSSHKNSLGEVYGDDGKNVMLDKRYSSESVNILKDAVKSKNFEQGYNRAENEDGYYLKDESKEKYKSLIENEGIAYKQEGESLWINKSDADKLLEKVVTVDSSDEVAKEKYTLLKPGRNVDLEEFKSELSKSLPADALSDKGSGRGILVKSKYTQQTQTAIDSFNKREPYWEDGNGGYYYRDKSLPGGIVVKNLSKPENGRNMGKYGLT